MASVRKKQDEKNLKILRELVSLPGNKHCFDCNQRGPTYINMTIGSFVCTKCSGILRGLTPPHRVKSISMASFTSEEVDLIKSRGNDVCRQTWLALYDLNAHSETRDEQQIKDFMVDKYERKRYYHDKGLRNGTQTTPSTITHNKFNSAPTQPISVKTINNNSSSPDSGVDFVADFSSADIFSATQFNNNASIVSVSTNATASATATATTIPATQPSFANFDNNIIFHSETKYSNSYDLLVSQLNPMPQFVLNRWNVASPPLTVNGNIMNMNGLMSTTVQSNKTQIPPSEDRYAALKDLDNALKNQQQEQHLDWNAVTNSNGSGYTSSTPLYGSPSNAQSNNFMTVFQQDVTKNVSNPFALSNDAGHSPWFINGNSTAATNSGNTNSGVNPFRAPVDMFNGAPTAKFNDLQQRTFPTNSSHFANNHKPWVNPNPFTLGVSPGSGTSNNPFL